MVPPNFYLNRKLQVVFAALMLKKGKNDMLTKKNANVTLLYYSFGDCSSLHQFQ